MRLRLDVIKKILGILTRLLVAAGAEKWKQSPVLKVQSTAAAASMLEKPVALIPVGLLNMGTPISVQGPVEIPTVAPDTIVQVVPEPFSWKRAGRKIGAQLWRVFVAGALVAAVKPEFYADLGLSEGVVLTLVGLFGLLAELQKHGGVPERKW